MASAASSLMHAGRSLGGVLSSLRVPKCDRVRCSVAKTFDDIESSNESSKNEKRNSKRSKDFDFSSAFPRRKKSGKKYAPGVDSRAPDVLHSLKDTTMPSASVHEILDSATLNLKDLIHLIKDSHWETALEIFRWMKSKESYEPRVIVYNVLIKTLSRQKQWKLADDLAKEMIQEGLEPDNFTYSSLINSASKSGYHHDAIKWFEHMQNSNCIPDEITYCAAISAMSRTGNLQRGLELYEQMLAAGWRINEITSCAVVNMYGKSGLYDEAHKLFLKCKEDAIRPNAVFYNTMIHIYCSAEKLDLAFNCLEEMKAAGLQLDSKSFTPLIFSLGRMKHDSVDAVFQDMEDCGVKPDALAFNALLFAYRNSQRYDDAERTFQRMQDLNLVLSDITLKEMLRVYAEKGDVEKAYETMEEIKGRGFPLDLTVLTNLMCGFGKAGLFEEARNAYDLISEHGLVSDHFVLSGLFSILSTCTTSQEALPILRCIRQCKSYLYDFMVEGIPDESSKIPEQSSTNDKESKDYAALCLSEIELLFKSVPSDSLNPLVNSILNALYHLGLYHHAEVVYSMARKYGAFASSLKFNSQVWQYRISGLSVGSSSVLLHCWLLDLKERINAEEKADENKISVEILVGLDSPLKECKSSALVASELDKMGLPLDLVGPKFVLPMAELKAWVSSDNSSLHLLLKNEPVSWLADAKLDTAVV